MTPGGRAGAAVAVLDRVLAGDAAEASLLRWSRGARYAGAGDRAAVRDLVFDALRRRREYAALGGGDSGRGLVLGALRARGEDEAAVFGAGPHAPAPVGPADAGRAPAGEERLNLPAWLLPAFVETLGPDLPQVAAGLSQRAPVWLRANALKAVPAAAVAVLAEDGIAVAPAPRLPTALRVTEGARALARSRAYREGLVELQDVAPQRAVASLGDLRGVPALDLCAGGGGKSLALAAAGARVTAWDADPGRMADLPARAARAGARISLAPRAGPRGAWPLVVADVPCSGSGTWARNPDARWRLTPEGLARLLVTQAAILDRAAGLLAPGGRLALMTCSLLRAENDDQADALLARHPALEGGPRRLWTPREGGDGFYVALFSRSR